MTSLQDVIVNLRASLAGDMSARIIAAAAIVFFLVVVVTTVVLVARMMTPSGRLRSLLEAQAERERRPAWAMRIVGLLLVFAALFGVRYYLASPNTCAQCHAKSVEAKTLASSAHKGVACGDCHGGSGPTGGLRLGLDYVRWTTVWVTVGKLPKQMTASVDSAACLGCHGDIWPTRTVGGVKVRHADFLDDGQQCLDCHAGQSHPTTGVTAGPTMNQCLPCHDGRRASSACETCHTRDLAQRERSGPALAQIVVSGAKDSCYTCHDPAPCTRCHGVKMPHPDGWSPNSGAPQGGSHVREAFVHLDRCWRCHYDKTPGTPSPKACSCHQLIAKGGMHGGPAWIEEHGLEATGKKAGALADCFTCHPTTFCSDCHPKGYEKLYNPKLGVDDYPRTKPLDPKWMDY